MWDGSHCGTSGPGGRAGLVQLLRRPSARARWCRKSRLWYDSPYEEAQLTVRPAGKDINGVILGRHRFAKISAVEGIELSPAAKKRAAEYDRLGLSSEERVRRIVAIHRKG